MSRDLDALDAVRDLLAAEERLAATWQHLSGSAQRYVLGLLHEARMTRELRQPELVEAPYGVTPPEPRG